jgi:hypothetical protein
MGKKEHRVGGTAIAKGRTERAAGTRWSTAARRRLERDAGGMYIEARLGF